MYTLPIYEIYTDVNDMVMSLTRVAYTATDIIADITHQIMMDEPIKPWDPDPRLYGKKSQSSMSDMAVDRQALEGIYVSVSPRIKNVLTEYFTTCQSFDCGVAIKGRQLIILTSNEIVQWEKLYGRQHLLCTWATRDNQ